MNLVDWLKNIFKPKPKPAPPMPPSPPMPSDFEEELRSLMNGLRRNPLTLNAALSKAAATWASYMASQNKLAHIIGDSSPASRIEAQGYNYTRLGECIDSGQRTPKEAFQAWKDSPLHRPIMIDESYGDVGYGQSVSSNGTMYWCANFGSKRGTMFTIQLSHPKSID